MRLLQICLIILLVACKNNDQIPEDIIEPEKMALILRDVHLLEAKVSQLFLKKDSAEKVYYFLEKEIFAKHQIDSAGYANSLDFYADNPALYHDIYEIVVDSLMLREKNKNID